MKHSVVNPCLSQDKKWTSVHDRYVNRGMVLGEGSYGVVYGGHCASSGRKVAIKRCRLDMSADEMLPTSALREVVLMKELNHDNVLRLDEVSANPNRMYMVAERMPMDLREYIRKQQHRVSMEAVKSITYQILLGLSWCHGHRIMHRDLKPANILIDKNGPSVKIADFGLARPAHAPGKTITHEVVTLWYRAPELLLGSAKYSDGIDMWSVGCILAELLSGSPVFQGDSELETVFKIFSVLGTPTKDDWDGMGPLEILDESAKWPQHTHEPASFFRSLREGIDEHCVDLLAKILLYNPSERIGALDAIQHPWFKKMRHPTVKARRSPPQSQDNRQVSTQNSGDGGWRKGRDTAGCQNKSRVEQPSVSQSDATGVDSRLPPVEMMRSDAAVVEPSCKDADTISVVSTQASSVCGGRVCGGRVSGESKSYEFNARAPKRQRMWAEQRDRSSDSFFR